jgi:hypothetical protein
MNSKRFSSFFYAAAAMVIAAAAIVNAKPYGGVFIAPAKFINGALGSEPSPFIAKSNELKKAFENKLEQNPHFKTLQNDAERSEVLRSIRDELESIDTGGIFVLHYIGHGIIPKGAKTRAASRYLAMNGANVGDNSMRAIDFSKTISLSEILEMISDYVHCYCFIYIDACFSGTTAHDWNAMFKNSGLGIPGFCLTSSQANRQSYDANLTKALIEIFNSQDSNLLNALGLSKNIDDLFQKWNVDSSQVPVFLYGQNFQLPIIRPERRFCAVYFDLGKYYYPVNASIDGRRYNLPQAESGISGFLFLAPRKKSSLISLTFNTEIQDQTVVVPDRDWHIVRMSRPPNDGSLASISLIDPKSDAKAQLMTTITDAKELGIPPEGLQEIAFANVRAAKSTEPGNFGNELLQAAVEKAPEMPSAEVVKVALGIDGKAISIDESGRADAKSFIALKLGSTPPLTSAYAGMLEQSIASVQQGEPAVIPPREFTEVAQSAATWAAEDEDIEILNRIRDASIKARSEKIKILSAEDARSLLKHVDKRYQTLKP